MKCYIAVKDDSAIYLSKKAQVDKYLAAGCQIYVEDDSGRRLIAGDGLELTEEIELEHAERMQVGGVNHG